MRLPCSVYGYFKEMSKFLLWCHQWQAWIFSPWTELWLLWFAESNVPSAAGAGWQQPHWHTPFFTMGSLGDLHLAALWAVLVARYLMEYLQACAVWSNLQHLPALPALYNQTWRESLSNAAGHVSSENVAQVTDLQNLCYILQFMLGHLIKTDQSLKVLNIADLPGFVRCSLKRNENVISTVQLFITHLGLFPQANLLLAWFATEENLLQYYGLGRKAWLQVFLPVITLSNCVWHKAMCPRALIFVSQKHMANHKRERNHVNASVGKQERKANTFSGKL